MNKQAYIAGYRQKQADSPEEPQAWGDALLSGALGGGVGGFGAHLAEKRLGTDPQFTGAGAGGILGLILTKALAKNPDVRDYLAAATTGALAGGGTGTALSKTESVQADALDELAKIRKVITDLREQGLPLRGGGTHIALGSAEGV